MLRVAGGAHLDGQTETVEQLRAQLTLLRVHRADKGHAGGVRNRNPIALNGVAAHRGGVEEEVDEVVVQQVDLVDVQQAAMRLRQQAGLEAGLTGRERLAQIERADHAVLGRADREFDQSRRAHPGGCVVVRAVGAVLVAARVAAETAALDHLDVRQHLGEGAHHGRLRGALLAAHQHTTDLGRDGGEHESKRHVVGTDDGRKRKLRQRDRTS